MEQKQRIGIDIGNVIIGGGGDDTSFFSDGFLNTPEIEDAFSCVGWLNTYYEVWLLSKCGQATEEKTLLWLEDRSFHELTGVPAERILFCRKRPQKAPIAVEHEFKVFIDDREDIINSMKDALPFPILFTSWEQTMQEITRLRNWGKI